MRVERHGQVAALRADLLAIHRGQGHGVVDQHHRAGRQHRHARQARQSRQLGAEVLHHDFLVAQHFVHVHRHALRSAAENHHGARLARRFHAARGRLQQRARPEERQQLAARAELPGAIGFLELGARGAAHDFHEVGGHAHRQVSGTQHDHLGHRGGQRQHHAKRGALALFGAGFDAPAQGVDLGAHHVHADATPREARHLLGGGEARHEDQIGRLGIAHLGIGRDQPLGHGLGTDALDVEPRAIVTELDGHVVALVVQRHRDDARRGLAVGQPFFRRLDAMGHAVAQQVLECRGHAVEHATVHLDGTARDIELDLLARFLGRLAHHGIEALGDALELHHARAQQVPLQLACLAALRNEVVLRAFQGTLQIALHRGHVVHRLGHHARELLHPCEAVEFERVKACSGVFGLRKA